MTVVTKTIYARIPIAVMDFHMTICSVILIKRLNLAGITSAILASLLILS